MDRKRRSGIRRFASSALIAAPVTLALLFLMTRLILPGEDDRIITRMIYNIELQRAARPPDNARVSVFKRPEASEKERLSTQPNPTTDSLRQSQNDETRSDENAAKERHTRVIDWWAEAQRVIQQLDEEAFKRWTLEQGYESYVSIMQGPLPITNSVQAKLPPNQEDATGYMNIYGDLEYKISENCVATTQVAARFDRSDFVKSLPMIITCWPAPKQNISFARYDRE